MYNSILDDSGTVLLAKSYPVTGKVQPVFKDHPRKETNVVLVNRLSLIAGSFIKKMSNWKLFVWLLYTGNCYTKVVFSTGLTVYKSS